MGPHALVSTCVRRAWSESQNVEGLLLSVEGCPADAEPRPEVQLAWRARRAMQSHRARRLRAFVGESRRRKTGCRRRPSRAGTRLVALKPRLVTVHLRIPPIHLELLHVRRLRASGGGCWRSLCSHGTSAHALHSSRLTRSSCRSACDATHGVLCARRACLCLSAHSAVVSGDAAKSDTVQPTWHWPAALPQKRCWACYHARICCASTCGAPPALGVCLHTSSPITSKEGGHQAARTHKLHCVTPRLLHL
jgi:hypothetical protein